METVTRIGITMGDPTGIGPEITAAALSAASAEFLARISVYGQRAALVAGARAMNVALPASLSIVEPSSVSDGPFKPGSPDEHSGAAQVAFLEAAVSAAQRGDLAAIVTAPISKTWVKRAGFAFPGHTEYLADRFGAPDVRMLFAGPRMKVALATIHIPLAEVPRTLTTGVIRRTAELLAQSCIRDFGMTAPRIGVVGLNPHAGEGGLLGREDDEIVAPALLPFSGPLAKATLHGPLVPDAAFRDALHGKYDALVALYHDQGLIPVKLVDFDEAVNVTLGLPIVRTSPDHGTAYDIAGKGVARAVSMERAIKLAAEMLTRRA